MIVTIALLSSYNINDFLDMYDMGLYLSQFYINGF